jgi:hypothetical protein
MTILLGTSFNEAFPAESSEPLPEWRGNWLVVKDLGAPGISALGDEDARKLIGASILIKDGSAVFAGDTCPTATYAVETQSLEDFLLTYQLTPTQLRLRGKRVRSLEVSCSGGPFHDLSWLDDGCVVLVWEGRFFQVARNIGAQHVACMD